MVIVAVVPVMRKVIIVLDGSGNVVRQKKKCEKVARD